MKTGCMVLLPLFRVHLNVFTKQINSYFASLYEIAVSRVHLVKPPAAVRKISIEMGVALG